MPHFKLDTTALDPQHRVAEFEAACAQVCQLMIAPTGEDFASRTEIVERAARYGLKFGLNPPRPPHWGGFRLIPEYWEFWQGRPSRLHDRLYFSKDESDSWKIERLAP